MWFGWSGDVVSETVANAGPTLEQDGAVTFATVGLTRKDYDQYYRGFSNATLWPVFHYRNDLAATSARNTRATGASMRGSRTS